MKIKNYNKKRKDLKDFKKVAEERGFEDTRHRKAFKEDIKRSFRSLKRSEKQIIEKQIEEELE
jgi:hypothetical protein